MKKIIMIEGMSCNHCVNHVSGALKELEGIINVQVSLEEKQAVIEMESEVSDDAIKAAIEDWGYEVVEIKKA